MSKKYKGPRQSNNGLHVVPKTEKQKEFFEAIKTHPMTVAIGVAGTGKSWCPVMLAAKSLLKGEIDKIVLTRPNVDSGEPLGFSPGTQDEKMSEWLLEPLRVLRNVFGSNDVDCKIKNGVIQMIPFQKMRSITISDAFVILDEAQNTTEKQMELFSTRIGENVRVIINGDITQDD